MTDYLEFLRERLGKNWVVARRTSRIVARYGEDVNCVGRKRYAEVEREYCMLFGDPYDKPRAAMYLALMEVETWFGVIGEMDSGQIKTLRTVRQALEAEHATFPGAKRA